MKQPFHLQKFTFPLLLTCILSLLSTMTTFSQGTRLLRMPSLSATHVAFSYGGDIWITDLADNTTLRITSTAAVESNPHISPDGRTIAFTSNRSGNSAVYTVALEGGEPTRLTWHPSGAQCRGWNPDGSSVLYATSRDSAPTSINRLWTASIKGGPTKKITEQWGFDGSYSADAKKIVIDRVSRWESEFRGYRGGQNTPLVILNLENWSETLIPNESTIDIKPIWLGDKIYFLSDRDGISNIWSFNPANGNIDQLTSYTGSDIKYLDGNNNKLVFVRDGYLSILELETNSVSQLNISITADFPWAAKKWEDVSKRVRNVSISPTGKRAILEARGEIFTTPVEFGDARNITQSSNVADRAPIWSPKGNQIAWFSDGPEGYKLIITDQNGLSEQRSISIGDSKMAWEVTWSPDGKFIAFVDDQPRIRVIDIKLGSIRTVDVAGANIERGNMSPSWSPDSRWLVYSKTAQNNFRSIMVWNSDNSTINAITNSFADAVAPSWDKDGRHLYFLASTNYALRSGWANTSSRTSSPAYSAYVVNLKQEDDSPFELRSDEEEAANEDAVNENDVQEKGKKKSKKKDTEESQENDLDISPVEIDFDNLDRRTIPLLMPDRAYAFTASGPKGIVFIAENVPNKSGFTLHKFSLEKRESKEFASGIRNLSISSDGEHMIVQINNDWKLVGTKDSDVSNSKPVKLNLQMNLSRTDEWGQIFEEAWRYEKDYFYDPNLHGRDWQVVHDRYAPLMPYVKHRFDLTYVLDQMNGELSVGHSFVFGGDYPDVEKPVVGLLGADLQAKNGYWNIARIYTTESWNPGLTSPLDRPGLKIKEGDYLVGINGRKITSLDNPYKYLDGTMGVQTVVHINSTADFNGAWQETIEPIRSENALRQRTWVEDNRRLVDKLSDGKLGYVWVPNTGGRGFVSFNRYFFAQQDKLGAVIDERFNGGGSLDDYMVDLMNRSLRAAITNEVPNGKHFTLPAGILGPKVLLINEMAGSGGDYFPWAFRQQKIGALIGTTTWGGLVKSSVHYPLVDGGALTAPDNAVFDPINNEWIAENKGIEPDIEVRQDALSLTNGRDPQLERAVDELLAQLEKMPPVEVKPPPFSTPAKHDE